MNWPLAPHLNSKITVHSYSYLHHSLSHTHFCFPAGKTELDLGDSEESPVKRERSEVQDEMVELFGSEKKKRAFAAYKRNKVGSEALEAAITGAVSHAGTTLEATDSGMYHSYI